MGKKSQRGGKKPILTAILTVIAIVLVLMRMGQDETPTSAPDATRTSGATPAPTQVAVQPTDQDEKGLTLTVLEVGKADCLVLQCEGESMIVDGGNENDEEYILAQLESLGIKWLKYLVNTHPHEDHLGSLDAVVYAYPVGQAILSPKEHTTANYERLLTALEEREVPVTVPKPGDVFLLGGATVTVLSPDSDDEWKGYNDWSIVLMVQYGDVRYLLMGDAETPVEGKLIEQGVDLRADVLKLGHHGSATSSRKSFLSAVSPTWALITCDRTEQAGEPHEKVVRYLEELSIPSLRTDVNGVLTVYTDGQDVAVSTERE